MQTKGNQHKKTELLFNTILNLMDVNGYPPTVTEIAAAMGGIGRSTIDYHKKELIAIGLLRNEDTLSRAICVPGVHYATPKNVRQRIMTPFCADNNEKIIVYLKMSTLMNRSVSEPLFSLVRTHTGESPSVAYSNNVTLTATKAIDNLKGLYASSWTTMRHNIIGSYLVGNLVYGLVSDVPDACALFVGLGWHVYDPMTVVSIHKEVINESNS